MGSWDDIEPEKTGLDEGDDTVPAPRTPTRSQAARINQEKIEGLTFAMAAMKVRRAANQHGCAADPGGCDHEDHRRDVDLLGALLETLGLPGKYQAITEDERANWLDSLKVINQPVHFNDLD